MRHLLLSSILLLGCGEEYERIDPGPASLSFAGEDARGAPCDPIDDSGCSPVEKCGVLFTSGVSVRAECFAEGGAGLGQTCVMDAGRDDCMRGLRCSAGVCREVCRVTPDSCPAERYCAPLEGWFEVGVCEPACELFGDDCGGGEDCCLALGAGSYAALCAPRFAEPPPSAGGCGVMGAALPGVAGDCCSYVNTCGEGLACVWAMGRHVGEGECAYLCDPTGSEGGAPSQCDPPGPGPAPDYVCRPLREVERDARGLPDCIGLCVPNRVARE